MEISEIVDMTHTIENIHEESVDFRRSNYNGLSSDWLTAETAAMNSLKEGVKL